MKNKNFAWWVLAVVVVVIIVGAVVWRSGWSGTVGVPGTVSRGGGSESPIANVPNPPAQIVIQITAPAAGDVWKVGATHTVAWTEAPGVTGYVYLINVQTKNLVGVITPQIGPQQTSYPWDTRHLALSRTNPSQKDVVPGTYYVSMAFDGNRLPVISSPAFTIVN